MEINTINDNNCNLVLLTTKLGFEKIAASYIAEIDPAAKIIPSPRSFKGLILVEPSIDKHRLARLIQERVPEVERIIVAHRCAKTSIESIVQAAVEAARGVIDSSESFAVRTTRRGSHSFTSIDINIAVGDAVRRETNASVDLNRPDKIVAIEIIQDIAIVSVYEGSYEWRKMKPGKYPLYRLYRRVSVVQMPYLGPLDACYNMGVRIGREVQNFEVGELVIAPIGLVDAHQLKTFIEGVLEGVESRYQIQKKSYGRETHKVRVGLQDLYQLVRARSNEPIIVFEPEGEPLPRKADELYEIVTRRKKVNLLVGSREGIPEGVYRFADLVLDIAPGITISTDYAAASALVALGTILHEKLATKRGQNQ